jgi:hypothetical protein
MILLRLLLAAFNVAVVAFLIYQMVEITKQPVSRTRRNVFFIGGIMLLLAPLGIFFRFFAPAYSYFIIYPVAIVLFLYLTRQL